MKSTDASVDADPFPFCSRSTSSLLAGFPGLWRYPGGELGNGPGYRGCQRCWEQHQHCQVGEPNAGLTLHKATSWASVRLNSDQFNTNYHQSDQINRDTYIPFENSGFRLNVSPWPLPSDTPLIDSGDVCAVSSLVWSGNRTWFFFQSQIILLYLCRDDFLFWSLDSSRVVMASTCCLLTRRLKQTFVIRVSIRRHTSCGTAELIQQATLSDCGGSRQWLGVGTSFYSWNHLDPNSSHSHRLRGFIMKTQLSGSLVWCHECLQM